MVEAPVMTDPFSLMDERLRTLTKVMTPKAPIAQTPKQLDRSYTWIGVAGVLAIVYVVVLGHGVTLHF